MRGPRSYEGCKKPFFIISDIDIESYADNNTSYVVANNIDDLIKSLAEASAEISQWF